MQIQSSAFLRCISLILALSSIALSHQAIAQQQLNEENNEELREFLKQRFDEGRSSFKDRFDAEVWLVDMSGRLNHFVESPQERLNILRAVHREASASSLPPELVLAVIQIESHFDRFAVSRVGAQGLMQVMPFWKNELGRLDDNLMDIETNLRYGCYILEFYLKKEQGNLAPALARYNGSYGSTRYPEKVMTAWQRRWVGGSIH